MLPQKQLPDLPVSPDEIFRMLAAANPFGRRIDSLNALPRIFDFTRRPAFCYTSARPFAAASRHRLFAGVLARGLKGRGIS